jgi:hypothetical protein
MPGDGESDPANEPSHELVVVAEAKTESWVTAHTGPYVKMLTFRSCWSHLLVNKVECELPHPHLTSVVP